MDKFDITTIDIVFYHYPCVDGMASAWIPWRENQHRINDIQFIGCQNDGKSPDTLTNIKNKNILLVDFCFTKSQMIKLKKESKKLFIIDHHESNQRSLQHFDNCIFDLKRSAAQIMWDVQYPESNGYRPWFIEIIADRDLWKWEISNSENIGKGLYSANYYNWEKLEKLYTRLLSGYEDEDKYIFNIVGDTVGKIEQKEISMCLRKAVPTIFTTNNETYNVMLVTCSPHLRSHVGNQLCKNDCDFAAIYQYDFVTNQWWISLRGNDKVNLSKIAEKFGGGGHYNAAGFTIYGSKGQDLHSYFIKK